jgi:PAS domain S-box-containing protein
MKFIPPPPAATTLSFQDDARQRRRILIFLLLLSILLVSAAFYLGILVNGQISTLEANAQTTEAIVNTNIRTLAQVQRELLRTAVLLESGENDPAILDLQTSFLAQRLQEAALPNQMQTLGSAELLVESEQLAARFTAELRPLLVTISADPNDADQLQREAALGLIRELELGFEQLVNAGEINRKAQAGQVYDAAVVILDNARRLLWGLAGTILVMFFFFLLTAVYFTRFDRQRATAAATLQQLNRQLQEKTGELVEQRDFALQIMNNMGQGLTVVDEHGRFTYANPAFAAMVDEKPETLIGRSPVEFTPLTDQAVLNAAGVTRRRGATTTYETELQCRSGKSVAALITGVPRYRYGEFAGSIAVITDLSDRKAAEAALRASEAEARKLSQVASRTDNLVIIADAQGNAEWVNAAFTRITGYTLTEVIGTRPGRLLQGPETDPETVAYMRRRISAGKGFHCEVLNYARDGRPYWVAIEAQTVHDENGNLTHFIALETDITTRRQTEQRLRAAKESAEAAARAKAAFLATMSHEIRTPLNAVIGLNSLLLSTELNTEQQQIAETARRSGNLLLMLVNNVLDFSALEAGKVTLEKRPFSLAQCLDETRALLAHRAEEKGVTLTVDLDPALPPFLIGDETRLQQVLINLLGNGVKFTPEGSVQLCVQDAGAGQVAFTVSDSGIGIPPARRERLFQPFSQVDAAITRQYGGSGLGPGDQPDAGRADGRRDLCGKRDRRRQHLPLYHPAPRW